MGIGAVIAIVIGVAVLIVPVWLAWHLLRRLRRLIAWPRAKATVRRVRRIKHHYTSTSGLKTSTKTFHVQYAFLDEGGTEHEGETERLDKPKAGDIIEIMYSPGNPGVSDGVGGGSVGGRIITFGAVFAVLGGGGIVLILAPLGLLPG